MIKCSHLVPIYEGSLIIEAFLPSSVSPKIDKPDDLKIFFLIKHINRGTDFINISEMFRNLKIQKLYFDHIKEKKQSHTINCVIFRLRQN